MNVTSQGSFQKLSPKKWMRHLKIHIGLLEEGIDYDETYAPAARFEAIRMFLEFVANSDFKFCQMDVKSAFLNGELEEEIELLKKYNMENLTPAKTLMPTTIKLEEDKIGKKIDITSYRGYTEVVSFLEEYWYPGIARSSTQHPHQLLKLYIYSCWKLLCSNLVDEEPTPILQTVDVKNSNILRQHKCHRNLQQPGSTFKNQAHRHQVGGYNGLNAMLQKIGYTATINISLNYGHLLEQRILEHLLAYKDHPVYPRFMQIVLSKKLSLVQLAQFGEKNIAKSPAIHIKIITELLNKDPYPNNNGVQEEPSVIEERETEDREAEEAIVEAEQHHENVPDQEQERAEEQAQDQVQKSFQELSKDQREHIVLEDEVVPED
ncbi:hypothetical protein AgCh_017038 [Apium graveolens]